MTMYEVSIEQEIATVTIKRPHVVLVGAGASKAALPSGDKNGVVVPLLRDVAVALNLETLFPSDLQALAATDFEAAYSRLVARDARLTKQVEQEVHAYFERLQLPQEPNLYDTLNLSLRSKDAIFTFNWDPFLLQSRARLARLGIGPSLPQLYFLHGNVLVGFCKKCAISGLIGRRCSGCGELFEPSKLLFPVEEKNYQDGGLIEREWEAVRYFLEQSFMLTIFGYSAPTTDVEAIEMLKGGWRTPAERRMEQIEIINRPNADHDKLHDRWRPFIHTHHYEIHDSFYESWLGMHPRRSGEAYRNQFLEAKFLSDNPTPQYLLKLRGSQRYARTCQGRVRRHVR